MSFCVITNLIKNYTIADGLNSLFKKVRSFFNRPLLKITGIDLSATMTRLVSCSGRVGGMGGFRRLCG